VKAFFPILLRGKYYIIAKETRKVPTPLPIGHSFFDRVIEDGFYYMEKNNDKI
jgi:hypothetical protein